jgi:hypothetical protein
MPRKKQTIANLTQTKTVAQPSTPRPLLLDLIEVCVATPMKGTPGAADCVWGVPLIIEGKIANAKTSQIEQLGAAMGEMVAALYASQHSPEDFASVLIPDGKGGAKQICPLPQVRAMVDAGRGIIFLDEINGGTRATHTALQAFVHERASGDTKLPNEVRLLAAQNPVHIATNGIRLSPALANRFAHYSYPGLTVDQWISYKMNGPTAQQSRSLVDIEAEVIENWRDVEPISFTTFGAFLKANPASLEKEPAVADPQSSKAWPSPRTWDFAERLWTTCAILEKSDLVRDTLVECCVGPGAATEFNSFVLSADLPEPMAVLDGTWKIDKDRLDIVMMAYAGAVSYLRQRPNQEEKLSIAPALWDALKRLLDSNLADIAVPYAESMITQRLGMRSTDKAVSLAAQKVLVPLSKAGLSKYLEEQA